jgi:tetratricopeptide (TPR) repeat protein
MSAAFCALRAAWKLGVCVLLICITSVVAFAQDAPDSDADFAKAFYFGKKFADIGEYSSAYDQFAKANAIKADQPAVLYDMAVVLARAGRYSDAQVISERYQHLFPNGEEKANITKLQLELEFQRELQKKRQADQEYADLFNRAKYLYGRGELGESLQLFDAAQQLRPNDASAVFNAAVVLEKQGELQKAIERYRRYAEVETDSDRKSSVDQHVFALQHELEDMHSKIVCPFCGVKLPAGATWCPRCWHGPYLVKSAVWNTRPCVEGATATRATYFADERFNRNDILPCLFKEGSMRETLRYSAARQREIQASRKAEGWTYNGDVIQGWSDKDGNEIRFNQGPDYLMRIGSSSGGEILTYVAHPGGEGIWLLDREDLVIDAQKYTNQYTYDGAGRVSSIASQYQNAGACNHLIDMRADLTYANDALVSAAIKGGYDGFVAEGSPRTDWTANVAYTYDSAARVTKEELAVSSFAKTYTQKPQGALRDDINHLYTSMRVKKPIETMMRSGDLCMTTGSQLMSNQIDLRPFYFMSPNLAIALQNGVSRAVVTFTYPDAFKP